MRAGSSVEIEHFTPAASIRGSGCSPSDGHDAEAQIARRRDVADDAARRDLGQQGGVLDGAHAVPQAIGAQDVEGGPQRVRPGRLSGVRRGPEPALAGDREGPRKQLRRIQRLAAAEADTHDAALAEPHRPLRHDLTALRGKIARDVRGEAYLHPVPLTRLIRPGAVALEDLLPGRPPPRRLRRREDRLDVHATLRGRLRRVVHDDLVEVAGATQEAGHGDPGLDELREVDGSMERRRTCFGGGRRAQAIATSDLPQSRRTHRRLKVDVQFGLRVGRGPSYLRGSLPPARHTR